MSTLAKVTDVITPAHRRYDIMVMECDGYICFWETETGRYATCGEQVEVTDTVHLCPPIPVTDGIQPAPEEVMPCCGQSPLEIPHVERMTLDLALVTCGKSV